MLASSVLYYNGQVRTGQTGTECGLHDGPPGGLGVAAGPVAHLVQLQPDLATRQAPPTPPLVQGSGCWAGASASSNYLSPLQFILAKYLSMWLMAEGVCSVAGLSYCPGKVRSEGRLVSCNVVNRGRGRRAGMAAPM